MNTRNTKASALIIDDDPEFQQQLERILIQLGFIVLNLNEPKQYKEIIQISLPNLILVDLNLGQYGSGHDVIDYIRKERGYGIPIMAISGDEDAKSIAHSLESGANDYIVKTFDISLIASKLARFVPTDKVMHYRTRFFQWPGNGVATGLSVDTEIKEIDELGVKIIGSHLFSTGTPVKISGTFIREITGKEAVYAANIVSNWVEPDQIHFGAYAEFDQSDQAFIQALRKWLVGKG
jgi:CheY-like chemotaxis protein